jgi:hypothetical protein
MEEVRPVRPAREEVPAGAAAAAAARVRRVAKETFMMMVLKNVDYQKNDCGGNESK